MIGVAVNTIDLSKLTKLKKLKLGKKYNYNIAKMHFSKIIYCNLPKI
jgi:hypothetical protein